MRLTISEDMKNWKIKINQFKKLLNLSLCSHTYLTGCILYFVCKIIFETGEFYDRNLNSNLEGIQQLSGKGSFKQLSNCIGNYCYPKSLKFYLL